MIRKFSRSYLENRKQIVDMNREKPSIELVSAGIPHGSVLGHLLFLNYLNEYRSRWN